MNELINPKFYDESVSYQILGGEKQTLQVIMMPGQSLITRRDAVLFSSENISTQLHSHSYLLRI